jgi:hypothetical protein
MPRMTITTSLLFIALFAGLAGAVDLGQCLTLATEGAYYTLNQSVSSDATCFTISAENITLDCAGYTVNYSAVSTGYGVYTNQFNTTVKNCNVNQTSLQADSFAVYYSSASNGTAYNNTITTLGWGGVGIYLNSNSNYNNASNNSITTEGTYGYGLYIRSSFFNNASNNNATTAGENGRGLYFRDAGNNSATNSVINSAIAPDVYVMGENNYTNNLTNCTFDKSDTEFFTDTTDYVNVFWHVNVHTIKQSDSSDLASVNVNITDVNGTTTHNLTTNATGWVYATILEYMQNATSVYNATPHYFNATKDGYTANNSVQTIDESKTITIALTATGGDTPPNVSISTPANATVTSVTTINFTFTPTDDSGFKNCTTLLWYGNGTFLNDTNWNASAIVNDTLNGINYSFAADGVYLWNVECWDDASQSNVSENNNTLTIDSAAPSAIAYVSPTPLNASTQYYAYAYVNVTFTETNPDSCLLNYIYPNSTNVNLTMSRVTSVCWLNVTSQSDGEANFSVYVNDSAGSWGSNETYYYFTVDSTAPASIVYVSPTPANASVVTNSYAFINVSFVEANPDTCLLDYVYANSSEVNFTMTLVGSTCYFNVTNQPNGDANFTVYVNDSAGSWGSNLTLYNFTVNYTAAPVPFVSLPACDLAGRRTTIRAFAGAGLDVNGSEEQLVFGSKSFDVRNEFDNASSVFTPLKAGYYSFSVSALWWNFTGSGELTLTVKNNGVAVSNNYLFVSNATRYSQLLFDSVFLSAGDNVTFFVNSDNATSVYAGSSYTSVSISKVFSCLLPVILPD